MSALDLNNPAIASELDPLFGSVGAKASGQSYSFEVDASDLSLNLTTTNPAGTVKALLNIAPSGDWTVEPQPTLFIRAQQSTFENNVTVSGNLTVDGTITGGGSGEGC